LGSYIDYDGEHQGQIKQVYSYKNQIIVSITRGVVSFELKTGKLLWHVKFEDFNPNELHLSGNKAYLAKGIFYAAIDLDKGEKILETNLGENINVDGTFVHRVNARPDIAIYNNKIWHLDRAGQQVFFIFT